MKEKKICANPECGREFTPYHGRQKVCGRTKCRLWLYEQNTYKRKRYKTPKGEIVTLDDLQEIE